MGVERCCPCNGARAKCKRCVCREAGRQCSNCQCRNCSNRDEMAQEKIITQRGADRMTETGGSPPQSRAATAGKKNLGRAERKKSAIVRNSEDYTSDGIIAPGMEGYANLNKATEDYSAVDIIPQEEIDSFFIRAVGESITWTMPNQTTITKWQTLHTRATTTNNHLYRIPRGSIGQKYVDILTTLTNDLANGKEDSEKVLVFSIFMLYRDKDVKKQTDITKTINKRIARWTEDRTDELIEDLLRTKTQPQKHKHKNSNTNTETTHNKFIKLMKEGNIQTAVRTLSEHTNSGPLEMTPDTIQQLQNKHPHRQLPHRSSTSLDDPLPELHTLNITESHIWTVAHNLTGGYGPSGTDSNH
eukprot:GHVR01069202.1.p1 GENE.GHVR01069202.1~~GHVR01069202.1.p1  ORF type:complete len:358 (+),score=43.77 GHVR01069202.1:97-1170(+)